MNCQICNNRGWSMPSLHVPNNVVVCSCLPKCTVEGCGFPAKILMEAGRIYQIQCSNPDCAAPAFFDKDLNRLVGYWLAANARAPKPSQDWQKAAITDILKTLPEHFRTEVQRGLYEQILSRHAPQPATLSDEDTKMLDWCFRNIEQFKDIVADNQHTEECESNEICQAIHEAMKR